MKKPRCKYTDFSIPVKGYNAKLCFTTYNKNKRRLSFRERRLFHDILIKY